MDYNALEWEPYRRSGPPDFICFINMAGVPRIRARENALGGATFDFPPRFQMKMCSDCRNT
jgi:hypothetical protein